MPRPLIVIADPNAATRELLDDVFRYEENAVTVLLKDVSDLGSALFETVPDLALVEIGRDRIADIAAVHELTQLHAEVPFFVLTAYGLDVEDLAQRSGAADVIPKPFDVTELLERARALLDPRWHEARRGTMRPAPDGRSRTTAD